jgi:hypothetical protein
MSKDTPITKATFEAILEKKLEEKLKPFDRMMSMMDSLSESVKFLGDKFDSIGKKVDVLEAKYESSVKENKCLKSKVLRLSNITKAQDEEINNMQQYSRRDCVEISGIPEEPDENTDALTVKIGSLMGIRIHESDISISHRLPQKVQNESYSSRLRSREGTTSGNRANRFPKIIVKFARRSVKDQFYQGRRNLKDKTTKDLDFSLTLVNNIFISERLTSKNKELFKECLQFKKIHSFKYIWIQSGRIYLKKNKDLPSHIILSKQDLEALSR